MSHRARLSNTCQGEWELYVVTDGTHSKTWPTHDFHRTAPIPTLGERIEALAVLGFEPVKGAEWEWDELPYATTEWARLFGTLTVRPAKSGGAS
ncbi:DUF6303 family protein [Streptomyces sp. DH12]|uniref:DUF6303 family protein n=1 Tax=Streptomyces sp. DH12 TaxID=2857010 RepID=UPI001E621398|nr:DUF6303 family protein [Streptomyces sp. DH12]